MDPAKLLELADNWVGEGGELARRILAYADTLTVLPTSAAVAQDLIDIVSRDFDPTALR